MEKSKGKLCSYLVCLFITFVMVLSQVGVYTCCFSGCSKKDGSSNGAGSAGNYKHLAMEGSSLSDLESEDELQIDETPPPRRKPAGPSKKKKLSG